MSTPYIFTLSSQRHLAYSLYGSPARERWIIYLHGFPGSREEGLLWDEAARRAGLTVLAPDRPGFGSSAGYTGRKLLDWPNDVSELCAALAISHPTVIGVSGGCPYALACAYALPDLIASVHVVSGLASTEFPGVTAGMAFGNRAMFALMRRNPRIGQRLVRSIGAAWHASPRLCLSWFRAFVPPCDRKILDRPLVRDVMLQNIRTAFEHGPTGPSADFGIIARPWGFPLDGIKVPVTVWHGLADTYVPPAMGSYLAEHIPAARYHQFPGEGHLLVVEHLEEILRQIAGPEPTQNEAAWNR